MIEKHSSMLKVSCLRLFRLMELKNKSHGFQHPHSMIFFLYQVVDMIELNSASSISPLKAQCKKKIYNKKKYQIFIIIFIFSQMKDFIKFNIENIKGVRRASSLIQKQTRDLTPTKPKLYKNKRSPEKPYQHINTKVKRLQMQLSSLKNESNIMQDINEIKNDIKMIKSFIFSTSGSKIRKNSEERYEQTDDQETIYTVGKQARMKSHSSEVEELNHSGAIKYAKNNSNSSSPQKRIYKIQDIIQQKMKRSGPGYNKSGISLKVLLTIAKDYKLEGPQSGTLFYGYAKRNSQPVVVKYFEDKIDKILEVYDKLWKNIAKAEWPCINRVLDYKTDEINILVLQKNKNNIVGLPYKNILIDLVKIMQFIHDCGYLYRNIEPEHFMLNQEGQLVIIDFKRARRYIDIKGHSIQISDAIYTGSPFASNNQVRGLPESRKDDLQSIGYLSLLLNEMEIPWGGMIKDQVIKVRSSLTLQELFKGKPQWIQYMAYVVRLPKNQRPDYRYLCQLISQN